MSQRRLTSVEREQIYIQKQAGKSLQQAAKKWVSLMNVLENGGDAVGTKGSAAYWKASEAG